MKDYIAARSKNGIVYELTTGYNLKGYEDRFFYYHNLDKKCWYLIDKLTGYSIGSANSRKELLEASDRYITNMETRLAELPLNDSWYDKLVEKLEGIKNGLRKEIEK